MSATGTIIVNVFTSDARIPVEGATVLFQQQNPPYGLLAIRVTDISGKTPPLTIETAEPMESQSPETGSIPWTGLILQIDRPEYEKLVLTGVQIFPGVTTLQNAQLIPLQQDDPILGAGQDFIITPQPVWEDTP